ncbi:LOW QUALITY PROTEIN: FERM and PDZ domain-containing protein 2 [Phaethornis superciliosus]
MVQFALGSVSEVERTVTEDSTASQLDRSHVIRKRLHEKISDTSPLPSQMNFHQVCDSLYFLSFFKGSTLMNYSQSTEDYKDYRPLSVDYSDSNSISESTSLILSSRGHRGKVPQAQVSRDPTFSGSRTQSSYKLFINRSVSAVEEIPGGTQNSRHNLLSLGSTFSVSAADYTAAAASQKCLFHKKEKFSGPEFIILSSEPPVTLQLPGSIVTKKGKSYLSQRDLNVVLLNGQCLEVQCDIKSKARDVFNTVVAYANLVEHFYFGLAYLKGKEFFFLDEETKLYKVAPDGWNDQPKKKTSIINFTLFLRIKFFVNHFNVIQHSLTRHQFYLQLRKDILEERLYCNNETALKLGALALQAELGNYTSEMHGKSYFRVEDYVPASRIEKMTLTSVQRALAKLHRMNRSLFEDEAELQFLKVTQQLPEYGVLFYRVSQEKKAAGGDIILGICAKGIIVYEVKNHTRIASLRFQWRETERISAHRKKFMIESSFSGKKHTFITDTAKTCKYLLDLCSAQHKFNAQMNSRQLQQTSPEDNKFMEIDKSNSAYSGQHEHLALIQRLSRSENVLYGAHLENLSAGMMSKSCDNLSVETSNRTRNKFNPGRSSLGISQSEMNINLNGKQRSYDYLSIHSAQNTFSAPGSPATQKEVLLSGVEREIICVSLKRDPKNGFGFVIIGGENVGKLDLGIFIASIIPGGPADRAGNIKPGGRLISVNNISLEGVSFNTAVKIIQNSSDEVELIISQPKDMYEEGVNEEKTLSRGNSTSGSEISCIDSGRRKIQDCHTALSKEQDVNTDELEKTLTGNTALKLGPRVQLLPADNLDVEETDSLDLPSPSETRSKEIYTVELAKEDGTFGITGGINTSVHHGGIYVKSIIPRGPADKNGQIKIGDRLLEVDGISLCGITHKQAVEHLKKSGQIAKLALERGNYHLTEPCLIAHDRKGDQEAVVSVATSFTEGTKDYCFLTDDNTFEVKLTKNSGGLGFSVLQMEEDAFKHLGGAIVRIKRLFPGQPAAENGEIEVGDIILAVNGKPVQGLLYQDVLHLLRGAPPEVTLLLCRPPKGVLPEIEQVALTPAPTSIKEFTAEVPGCLQVGNNMDQSTSDGGSTSPDVEDCLESPVAGDFSEPPEEDSSAYEDQEVEFQEITTQKLRTPRESFYKHLSKFHQEGASSEVFQSLEDTKQNCYSPCEFGWTKSHVFSKSDDGLLNTNYMPETLSLTPIDEEYLTINSMSVPSLSRGGSLEILSPTMVTPQPQVCFPFSSPLTTMETQDSDNEWEDLEDLHEEKEEKEDCTMEMEIFVTLTRSENGYGFSVVLNKVDNCLYVDEILNDPALSDGRLRRGDRIIMVNGIDVTSLPCNEALALLKSSPPDLHLVVDRAESDPHPSIRPDEIPKITLTKGANGQLGLKQTGGTGSKLQGIYVLEIVPGSPASVEGSLQPDQIVYLWTEGISLDDAVRVCEDATQNVQIKATRYGNPVVPIKQRNRPPAEKEKANISFSNESLNPQEQHLLHQHAKPLEKTNRGTQQNTLDSPQCKDFIIKIELEKVENGSLGFALVGGRNGRAILIKAISPDSVADLDGRLQVGDILLKVNETFVSGLPRQTVIDLLHKAHGTVQLTVCRSMSLHWAYSGNWSNNIPSSPDTKAEPDITEGSLQVQPILTFNKEEESNQMWTKDTGSTQNSPLLGQLASQGYKDMICNISSRTQKHANYEGCRRESQQSQSDSWNNEDDASYRISVLPRSKTFASGEELAQLFTFKTLMPGVGPRTSTSLIRDLQLQIENQEVLEEFMALQHVKPIDDCTTGKAPENQDKNKYQNILPYDKTRVPLGEKNGCINASYIRMEVGEEELFYIVTQGPLPSTMADFWQMVWESESDVIAMMTKEVELGEVRCHRYWPEPLHDSIDLANFQLRLDSYQVLEYLIIRTLEIINKQTEEKRIISHLQFNTWPDHNPPKLAEQLVKFICYMRKAHSTGPIVAHDSTGTGRSGVLLCVEVLLSYIEKDLCFNIKQIVRDLRDQCFGIIQTKDEYLFCYEVVLEVLQAMDSF